MRKVLILLAVGAILLPTLAFSQKPVPSIPHMINYQGMLTDNSGNPLTGNFDITFRIYNASSDGTLRWEETHYAVTVTNGLFNVILGNAGTPINLNFYEEYWLDITVAGEHMPSRMKLTSVGYAYRAQVADTAAYAIGVPEGDLDDRYVNVIGPDSVRYNGSSNGFILTATGTNGDALYCRTYGSSDADAIKISTYGSAADGIVIDTSGDCGLEIVDITNYGIFLDDIHDDGLYMTDVAGFGIYMDDIADEGIWLNDVEGCGIWVNDAAATALYVDLANYGMYVDSTRAGGSGVWINHAKDDGFRVSDAGDDGVYVVNAGGDGLYVNHADRYGLYIYDSDDDGIRITSADGDGIEATGYAGGGELYSGHALNYGLQCHSYLSSSSNAGLHVYGYGSITGTWSTKLSGSSGDVPGYMITSTDVEVIASGTGSLVNGKAQINFEKEFQEAISSEIPVKVVLSAQGAPSGLLYVESKSNQGFAVQRMEIPGLAMKSGDVTFDWIAIGRQKGYEQRPKIIMGEEESGTDLVNRDEELRIEEIKHQQELERDELFRQQMLKRQAQKEEERIQEEREREERGELE